MNQPLKNLKKEALLLKLSSTEKAALHANLMKVIESSREDMEASAPRVTPSPFYFFSPQFAMPFAALLIMLLGGVTTVAAGGAVPGDFLYTVKTSVSEPVRGALAFSTEDKIKFHAEMAQTRLEEAEVLASQNRLDSVAVATLESSIDTHLSKRDALAVELDEKHPGASLTAAREINSSIAAHGEVLAVLGLESSSTTTRENSNVLASKVRTASASRSLNVATLAYGKASAPVVPEPESSAPMATTMALMVAEEPTSSEAADTSIAASNTNEVSNKSVQQENRSTKNSKQSREEKNAVLLAKRATTSLEALRRSVEATQGEVEEDVDAKLERRLSRVESLVKEGQSALLEGNFEAATEIFSEALDRSATLSTFISANKKFNNGILQSLLGGDDEGEEERRD